MERAKILIVEDEAIIAMEIESQLQGLGYEVTSIVDSGKKAIEKAGVEKPDIILMDIRIKGEMDGIEAAKIIRTKFSSPIIFSTAFSDDERINRAKITMPFGYLLKPIQESDLKVTIEMALYAAKVDKERRKTESALINSEIRYKELFNRMSSGVAVYKTNNNGKDFIFVDFNNTSEKIDKVLKEAVMGKNVVKVFPGIKEIGLFEVFQRVWKTGTSENHPISFYKDQRITGWRENYVYKLPTGEIVAVYDNITQRKLEEAKLAKSEKEYRDLYDGAPDMYFSVDAKTAEITNCNQTLIDALGYTKGEIIGRSIFDFYVPESAIHSQDILFPQFLKQEKVAGEELQVKRKDGSLIDVSLSVSAVCDSDGKVIQGQASWRDISYKKQLERERNMAEQQVRLERDKFQSVLNAIGEKLYIVSKDFYIEYHNKIIENLHGYSVGKKCYETFFNSKEICLFCPLKEENKKSELQIIETDMPDNKYANIVFSPYYDIDRNINTIVLILDITEKKTLQAEAMRAGHLASMGELSAGIAHEINNPINGIISLAELLKDQFIDLDHETEIPDRIIKEGDRVAVIVRNLLLFARDGKEDRRPAVISDILNDSVSLIGRQLSKDGITLQLDMPPDLPKIRARSQEIQQVFLNLLSNARYALNQNQMSSDKKKITITATVIQIEDSFFIQTIFQDTGTGIPKDIMDKITNPFYSTKPKGEGTGLGLSISHSIIKNHQGRIRFESNERDYTKVIIDLPVNQCLEIKKK